MNLSQLQYFCKLAELQHYTRAAEQLYITQPTLSNSISRLEDELGIPLFVRDGRNVRLTKYGAEFNRYAKQALMAISKGKALAQDEAGEYTGTVSIGTVYTIEDVFLPHLIKEFRAEYGRGPVIHVAQGLTKTLAKGLEDDTYDLIFCAHCPEYKDFQFVPVAHQSLAVIVHSTHRLARKKRVSLADLHGEHLIAYHFDTPVGRDVKKVLDTASLTPVEKYDDEITLASMVDAEPNAVGIGLDTFGFSIFPDLVTIPIVEVPENFHTIYLVYKKNSYKTPSVQHFIDVAQTHRIEEEPAEATA